MSTLDATDTNSLDTGSSGSLSLDAVSFDGALAAADFFLEPVVEQAYEASLPPGFSEEPIYSENAIPLNTVFLAESPDVNGAMSQEQTQALIDAALQVNPEASFAFLTPASSIESVEAETERLAEAYGLPEDQVRVFPDPSGSSWPWVRDSLRFTEGGVSEPIGGYTRGTITTSGEQGSFYGDSIASSSGLEQNTLFYKGAGGDNLALQRPDGERIFAFGLDTVAFTDPSYAGDRGMFEGPDNASILITISDIMEGAQASGYDVENVMPLGLNSDGTTYGDVLDQIAPGDLANMDPSVLGRLEEMRDVPFPNQYNDLFYHTDMIMGSADGTSAIITEPNATPTGDAWYDGQQAEYAQGLPAYREQLEFFGFDDLQTVPSAARSVTVTNPATGEPEERIETLHYANWVLAEGPNGEPAILLPTQAADPDSLTAADQEAIETLQAMYPDATIVPTGGELGYVLENQGGIHCQTLVSAHNFTPITE